MRAIVYVEGPSDKAAMQALLRPLIDQKRQKGIAIEFFDSHNGDSKRSVLVKVPIRAVNILVNDPHSVVVALPDLYPPNKAFQHETFDELKRGIVKNFQDALTAKGITDDVHLKERFKVFCFKHDLEALILASGEGLKTRLGTNALNVSWRIPVEDQNHDNPPKRVVEGLFTKYGKRYKDTVDAPYILGSCRHQDIAAQCPQCFKPFVDFLGSL